MTKAFFQALGKAPEFKQLSKNLFKTVGKKNDEFIISLGIASGTEALPCFN